MLSENLNDERVERALKHLATTDHALANAKKGMMSLEYAAKLAEHAVYLVTEGTAQERKATAESSTTAQAAWGKYFDAVAAYEQCRAKREYEWLVVDLYRTVESSRRQGNIK